jgi:GTP-sensing pleiotropic transcriptional regulator CodY
MMCSLYHMGVYSYTEFHWISTNFAVTRTAITETEALLPYDAQDIRIWDVEQARITFENNIAAVMPILGMFQQKGGSKVNRPRWRSRQLTLTIT